MFSGEKTAKSSAYIFLGQLHLAAGRLDVLRCHTNVQDAADQLVNANTGYAFDAKCSPTSIRIFYIL